MINLVKSLFTPNDLNVARKPSKQNLFAFRPPKKESRKSLAQKFFERANDIEELPDAFSLKYQIKNILDKNTDEYTYYVGTQNFKVNQNRLKDMRGQFTFEQINSFLLLIKTNELFEVFKILDRHPNYINISDATGRTPVHWSVIRKNEEMTDLLLHFRPDLKMTDLFRKTAIDYAKEQKDYNLVMNFKNYMKGTYLPEVESYKQDLFYYKVKSGQ